MLFSVLGRNAYKILQGIVFFIPATIGCTSCFTESTKKSTGLQR